jgi:polar amino acid transport system substrate-binding protein
MDFTAPYFDAHQLIAVRADSKVARFDDLKTLKVGVQTGTTGDEAISKLQGKTARTSSASRHAARAVGARDRRHRRGRRRQRRRRQLRQEPRRRQVPTVNDPAFAPEQYGIAVKKGNAELLDKLNKGLAAIRADGTYDRIYGQYLGAPPAAAAARSRRPRPPRRSSGGRAGGPFADLRWSILSGYGPLFLQGLQMTLGLTAVALTGGLGLGIVSA